MFAVGDNVLFSRSGAIHAGRVHSLGPKGMCKVMVGGHLVSMFEGQLSLDYKRGPRLAPEVDAHQEDMMNKEFDEELALTYSLTRKLNIERDDLAKWKDAMLKVESQWSDQDVAKELGLPVGTNIREGIMPAIQKLKRERDELREENSLLKKAPLRQKCQQLERDVDHWCDMHTVACKERGELREEIARMQTMAASFDDIIAKRDAMLEAMAETQRILLSIQLNDIFEDTMRNHARLAIEKLAPFLP